jgi:hypothetical protein
LLDIISKCSPKMLGQIAELKGEDLHQFKLEKLEWVGNCFMELVNLIIYERRELYQGWD